MSDFKYKVVGIDEIIEERGNTISRIREIKWGDGDNIKLDIRRYHIDKNGDEKMSKGFGFVTEDGPTNLTNILVEQGYGDAKFILKHLKDRDEVKDLLEDVDIDEDEMEEVDLDKELNII